MSNFTPPTRVIVITLRRLGDVLLTTPLIRTLKSALSDSVIDALVFHGTDAMLHGNPDLNQIITIPEHASWGEMARVIFPRWRKYDWAISTQTGDRPMICAWALGKYRVGFITESSSSTWWKRRAAQITITENPANHRIDELLRLTAKIGLPPRAELVPPADAPLPLIIPPGEYVVLHAHPKFRIRQWTDSGWRELARNLRARGFTIIATGGPDLSERNYLDRVWSAELPILRLDGKINWAEHVTLLRGARLYVGPDTSMTHLAAAVGIPTVAIYGPESPRRIGPWPIGAQICPWNPAGIIQHSQNVWVVQNPLSCLPCNQLGCERHLASYSRCLEELTPEIVWQAVEQALAFS